MKRSEDELKAWKQLMEDFDEALTFSEHAWLSASEPWEAALIRYQIKSWRSEARGEWVYVLDNLCTNLQEANCVISPELYHLLQKIGGSFGESASVNELKAWRQLMEDFAEALTLSEQLWLGASEPGEAAMICYQIEDLRFEVTRDPLLALKALCTSLQEEECPISSELYQLLQKIGAHLSDSALKRGIEPQPWKILESQVTGAP